MIHDKLGFRKACGEINLLVHEFVNAKDLIYMEQCQASIIEAVGEVAKYKTREILGNINNDLGE